MTIAATASEISYAGDGTSTVFPIPFPFDTSADLKVIQTDSSGNPVVLSSGFSTGGGGGSTGTLTLTTALPVGSTLTILDDPDLTQTADYTDNDAFPAATHEGALDRGVRISKRLYQLLLKCVRVDDGDPAAGAGMLLGSVQARKGKYLFFNAVTGAIEYAAALVTTTLSQSIIAQLLNPQTSAEAAAGATPTNYWIPSHASSGVINPRRFGGSSGTGDNTAAMNLAAAVAAQLGGGIIDLAEVGEWKMNFIFLHDNVKIRMAGGRGEFDQYCLRPYDLTKPALTVADGLNDVRYCGLINCHVSGTTAAQGVGNSPTAAMCAPQALLLKGGAVAFSTDDNCVIYSGIQTLALVPSVTKPVTACRLRGIVRNDVSNSASARALYEIRFADPGYNTANIIDVKLNSTGATNYAAEFVGSGVAFTALLNGYWDIKPGLGIKLDNASIISMGYLHLDPGANSVVVIKTTDSGTDISRVITGLVIADGQKWENGSATQFAIAVSSFFYSFGQVVRQPSVHMPINIATSTDSFSTAASISVDADAGPMTINGMDFSIKTVGKGLRVASGSNAKAGLSNAMVAGTVTVSTTAVGVNSWVIGLRQNGGTNPGAVYESARTAGTSITFTSTNAADTGRIAWLIIDAA